MARGFVLKLSFHESETMLNHHTDSSFNIIQLTKNPAGRYCKKTIKSRDLEEPLRKPVDSLIYSQTLPNTLAQVGEFSWLTTLVGL